MLLLLLLLFINERKKSERPMTDSQIRVKTRDGEVIEVDLAVAKQWQPIKNIYEINGTIDTTDKPIVLDNVDAETLHKIIEWATEHQQDELNAEGNEKKSKTLQFTEWDKNFFKVKQEMLFALIMGANYLGMDTLLDMTCKTVADMIKDKSPEEVRQTFNIPNDLPPEEELVLQPLVATTTQ